MSAMRITCLSSFVALRDTLANFESDHGFKLVQAPEATLFSGIEWFENLAQHGINALAKHPQQLRLVLVTDSRTGQVACLPLLVQKSVGALSNYYSGIFAAMLWQQEAGMLVWRTLDLALAQALRQQLFGVPSLRLAPLDSEAPLTTALEQGLQVTGFYVDRYFAFANWYLEVGTMTAMQYFSTLPTSLRNSIDRGTKRLEKAAWRLHIQQADDANLEAAIQGFVSVYNQSWKESEPNADFIPNLIRLAAVRGWLRLGVIELDRQPIAAQLWLVQNGKASIFKLAFVKGYERLSPGSVLTWSLMAHVIDIDKVSQVDYLSGDDQYKKDWMSHRRERIGLVAFDKRSLLGNWQALCHFARKLLQRLRKGKA